MAVSAHPRRRRRIRPPDCRSEDMYSWRYVAAGNAAKVTAAPRVKAAEVRPGGSRTGHVARMFDDFMSSYQSRTSFLPAKDVTVSGLCGVPKTNVKIFCRPPQAGQALGTYRCEAVLRATVDDVLGLLRRWRGGSDLKLAQRMILETQSQSVVENLDEATWTMLEISKLPWPLSPREFVYTISSKKLEDGSAISVQRSVEWPASAAKVQRGQILIGGMHLKPDREGHTRITYIGQVDPCGSIPKSVIGFFVDDMAHTLGRMQKEL
eukprot:TRINITY_DN9354_c2_g1_i1.p1 TRINITY_DN9354_c2_g1~~TRINITY_DN9354_c2_g1_i1.p1  ORF type:complete len:265 (+),score=71.13 TRINITY_DN9354_c2_g1_i1:97-891(+)